MYNQSKYKTIYVAAPFNWATGGVELAHQLVDYLRNRGCEAYIVYLKSFAEISADQSITKQYQKYNIKTSSVIEDSVDNILVLPEIYMECTRMYQNIKLACWWMSVDNRYNAVSFSEKIKFAKGIVNKLKHIKGRVVCAIKGVEYAKFKNTDASLRALSDRMLHFYQSRYAQHHLYDKGFSQVLPLTDYINLDLLGDINRTKKNVVLYNPSKGYAFTKKIIERMKDVEFVPLKGLNRDQLRELLETSKLYIDFGHFPGKDRLPREAVSNGCCILTGRNGASYFYEDVPIGCEYKFDTTSGNIEAIVSKIRYILDNYDTCKSDFDYYRERVAKEKEVFFQEIEDIFMKEA